MHAAWSQRTNYSAIVYHPVMASHDSLWTAPNLVVFLGAGASYDSGIPLGDRCAAAIVCAVINRVLGNAVATEAAGLEWPRLEVVINFFDLHLPNSAEDIVRLFGGIGLGAVHKELAQISTPNWLLMTTNFDDQTERAHAREQKQLRIVNTRAGLLDLPNLSGNGALLLKLHGDGMTKSPSDDLGATIGQILRPLPQEHVRAITAVTAGRPAVFIGYSARDPDLFPLVCAVAASARYVYWVDVIKPDKLAKPHQEKLAAIMGPSWREQYTDEGARGCLKSAVSGQIDAEPTNAWAVKLANWVNGSDASRLSVAAAAIAQFKGYSGLADQLLCMVPEEGQLRWQRLAIKLQGLLQLGKTSEAAELAIKATPRLDELEGDDLLRAGRDIGHVLNAAGRYKESLPLHRRFLARLADKYSTTWGMQATAALGRAQIYVGGDELTAGLETLKETIQRAQRAHDPLTELEARRWLAFGLVRGATSQQAYADAIAEASAVLDLESEIGDYRARIVAKNIIATALWRTWRPCEALDTYRETLQIATSERDKGFVAIALSNIALCHIAVDEDPFITADPLIVEAAKAAAESPVFALRATNTLHRGYLRTCCCRWNEALPFLQDAADTYLLIGDQESAGYARTLTAWAQLRSGALSRCRETWGLVQRENLTPRAGFAVDAKMVTTGLDLVERRRAFDLDGVVADFEGDHEQRFHLLLLASECFPTGSAAEGAQLRAATLDSAAKTGFRIYQAIGSHVAGALCSVVGRPLEAAMTTASVQSDLLSRHAKPKS